MLYVRACGYITFEVAVSSFSTFSKPLSPPHAIHPWEEEKKTNKPKSFNKKRDGSNDYAAKARRDTRSQCLRLQETW